MVVPTLLLGRSFHLIFERQSIELLHDLLQFVRHKIWLLRSALIPLQILEETEENGIDAHLVYLEKNVCHEVSAQGHENYRHESVVQRQRQASQKR